MRKLRSSGVQDSLSSDAIRSILGWSPGHGNFPRMVAFVIMLIFFLTGTAL